MENIFLSFIKSFFPTKEQSELLLLLEKTGLFDHFKKREIIALTRTARHVEYRSGDIIIREGEVASSFFIIEKGVVRVFTLNTEGEEIVLARLEAGAYFGEQALLESEPGRRNASVRAITNVKLFEILHQDLIAILARDTKLKQMLRLVGKKQLIEKLSQQFDILRSITDEVAASLAGNVLDYSDQQVIFAQGDLPTYVYFIISGKVNITLDEADKQFVTKLGANQIFGELGLLKKKPRSGTAVAEGDTKVLAIHAELFQQLLRSSTKLRELIGTLQQAYDNPARGVVTLYYGSFLNAETVNSTFQLQDGRIAIASRVVSRNIFTISIVKAPYDKKIRYQHEDTIRELFLANNKLVGVVAHGFWNDLGFVCGLLLDGIAVDAWQITLFEATGNLTAEISTPEEIICNCMCVSRDTIVKAIHAGAGTVESISKKTSAGTVCSTCVPKIQMVLGRTTWARVYITKVEALQSDVHSYRLKPYNAPIESYKPGQYVLIQGLVGKNWVERPYTLVSVGGTNDYYEIIVKCEKKGVFSPWLFGNDVREPLLRLSPPQGDFIFNVTAAEPAVFFAAGIGIVPAVAFVRALVAKNSARRLHIDFSGHTRERLLFCDELVKTARLHANCSVTTRMTEEQGRLTGQEVKDIAKDFPHAEFFVCGPRGFEDMVVGVLKIVGVPKEKIKIERFIPSGGPLN